MKTVRQALHGYLFFCFFIIFLLGTVGDAKAQDALLSQLEPVPVLSSDGLSVANAVAPLVMVADPDPNAQGIKTEGFSAAQTLDEPNAAAATFSITYVAAGGTDKWGQVCTTFPTAAKTAFNAAAAIWSNQFQSSVPITIKACWASLSSPSTLGYSGGGTSHRDFSGAPQAGTWYSAALANSRAGSDLDPANQDMHITYNSNFSWYYGLDGNPPYNQHDLVTVAAHEIAHGLNFAGTGKVASGLGSWGNGTGYPNIYDRFMRDVNGVSLLSSTYPNNSAALGTLLTSNNLWFRGANAMAANGGQPVKMYAPSSWASGSSYSHLNYDTFRSTSNSMMVYAIGAGSANHNPGAVTIGLLKDLGWQAAPVSPCVAPPSITVPVADADGVYTVTWGASSTTGVTYHLQEATNSTFTTGLRTAYSGTARTVNISGRSQNQTYYYRVWATKTGSPASGLRVGVNGCAVPGTLATGVPASIAVPVLDYDGAYVVSWGTSATVGVNYELQEATNSIFTAGLRSVYRGTARTCNITGRSQNVTYYYRVRAVKAGLKDSAYRAGATGCAVPGTVLAGVPTSITVPATDADGTYAVSWGASATAGVVYELEEATNNTFTAGLRSAYRGTARTVNITSRISGTTYYYRVRAVKAGARDSGYRNGLNGCAVTVTNTLANALDTTYSITTGGNANWRNQVAVSYYGGDAAQSGVIGNSQSSWMQTTVTGPGTISFYWKVSSESGFDYLKFYIDGVEQDGKISGEVVNWIPRMFTLGSGSHVLKWVYSKDGSASYGSDAGWVDKLVFSANTSSSMVGTWNFTYDWYCDGTVGTTSMNLQSNYRFSTGEAEYGSWVFDGTTYKHTYDNGTIYTSTGTVTNTSMQGTMLMYDKATTGCWTMNRSISAAAPELLQGSPEGTWSGSGK